MHFSGKTSLFRLLFRFYDPSSGEVRINNQNIKNCTLATVRAAIGVVPQVCQI
jgi:ABC-type multidrug transport system fused ATPase/permease subunit